MNKETWLGVVRHVLTFGGGFLASWGYIGSGDVEIAVGAVITLIGLGWSAWDKRGA